MLSDKLYSVRDVAKGGRFEQIPVHPITLYRIVEAGLIDVVRVGNRIFLSDENIADFIKRNSHPAQLLDPIPATGRA